MYVGICAPDGMMLAAVEVRDFRCYERASAAVGRGLTVVHGPNGAGKSNLLEAICFGCTSRSPRTSNERELIRFGCSAARVSLELHDEREEPHSLSVGFGALGGGRLEKRLRFDDAPLQRIAEAPVRPLVGVFVPDRLELLGGAPAIRRTHMDYLVSALWPARSRERVEYARALGQRNALIARIRVNSAASSSLPSWDLELAQHAIALSSGRRAAIKAVAERFAACSEQLGLAGAAKLEYRPASDAQTPEALCDELESRLSADLDRGYTTHGPHRDELAFLRDGRQLRAYGSQGERRLALLALLLAERAEIGRTRGTPPLMLLDDVMSELDESRRSSLLDELEAGGGQSVIATTEVSHVPGAEQGGMALLAVRSGGVIEAEVPA